jgi:hypothetical protein
MCGADEDKADQGYDAVLDRDGDVGRCGGLSVALDVAVGFHLFLP